MTAPGAVKVQSDIGRMIDQIRSIDGLGRKVAPKVARVVEAEIRRTTNANVTPTGEPWALKQDGGLALETAMSHVGVGAVGSTVHVILRGPTAMHHKGTARGKIRRQVIPASRTIPPRMAAEIRRVLDEAWAAHMGGGAT